MLKKIFSFFDFEGKLFLIVLYHSLNVFVHVHISIVFEHFHFVFSGSAKSRYILPSHARVGQIVIPLSQSAQSRSQLLRAHLLDWFDAVEFGQTSDGSHQAHSPIVALRLRAQ